MSDGEMRDELLTLLVAGHETTATSLAWAVERLCPPPGEAGAAARGGRGRRGGLPDRDDPGDAAAAPGDLDRRPPPHRAGRDRRLRAAGRRLGHALHLPDPPQPRGLPRARALPARALPRQPARHLHLDPLRRRRPPLPRRLLRPVRDGRRPARAGRSAAGSAPPSPSRSGSSAARSPRRRAATPRSCSAARRLAGIRAMGRSSALSGNPARRGHRRSPAARRSAPRPCLRPGDRARPATRGARGEVRVEPARRLSPRASGPATHADGYPSMGRALEHGESA